MNITVAICTWNRAVLLDQTIAQMRELRIPEGVAWELLVVNNNCTDDTDLVIDRHSSVLPIRRLFEPKQGHAYARNCAIDSARGELLIWTDDDVLVEENWLVEYVKAVKAWPDAAFFGGRIDPWYESAPPYFLRDALPLLTGVLATADHGPAMRRYFDGELPVGANMAVRRSALGDIRFDNRLGRQASELLSADEKVFCRRLCDAGNSGVWVPAARVRHFIPRERLSLQYLRCWFHGAGRTDVRLGRIAGGPMVGRVPRWIWRRYAEQQIKLFAARLTGSDHWFLAFRNTAILRGVIDEFRAQS